MTEQTNNALTLKAQEAERMLAIFGGMDSVAAQMEASEADAQKALSEEQAGSCDYVAFKRHGEQGKLSPWMYGRQAREIHPESCWLVDITTMQHGWMGYEPGPGGKTVKGRRPESVWTDFNTKFPEWTGKEFMTRAYKWRAMCISSPIEEQVGAFIENSDYRKMKEGYAELEQAVRQRFLSAKQARDQGNMDAFAQLMSEPFPVIQFHFELGVKTGNGYHNKGIIKHVGWSAQEVPAAPEPLPEAADEGSLEDEVEKAQTVDVSTRRRRRD